MGVHLKVKEEIEKKKNDTLLSGEEYIPLTDEMIISSCMQVCGQSYKTFKRLKKRLTLLTWLS